MNIAMIIGYLGGEPEVRYLPDGTPAISFNVATTERWKSRDGEKRERTAWHRCVKIGKGSDTLAGYLRKGSRVYVAGRINNRDWTDKDGQKRNITEIVIRELEFLDKRQGGLQKNEPAPDMGPSPDDDVPF